MRPQIQDNRNGQRGQSPPLCQVREGDENYHTTKNNSKLKTGTEVRAMFIYKQTEFFSKDGADLWTVGHMEGEKFIPESDHGRKEAAVERVKELNGGGSGHLVRPDGRINRKEKAIAVRVEAIDNSLYFLVNEAGKTVEGDFTTEGEARQFAKDNGYRVVEAFFVQPAQHTPGPWRQKESQFGGIVSHSVNFGPVGTTDYCEVSGPNAEANARLIAAAPELLEALKAMLKEDEGVVSAKSQHSVWTIKKAIEAIAEAEGRDVA